MGGEELLRVGPFLLCLWKKNVDGSLSLVIVCWSFKKGVVGKRCICVVVIQRCYPKHDNDIMYFLLFSFVFYAPLSSLMDSIASPKVKTMEGEGVGARSLACSTAGVEGCAGGLGLD